MNAKEITPVEVKGISYTWDNSICIDLIGGVKIMKFSPVDVLDMFHALLQAIGADIAASDDLFYAVDTAIGEAGEEEKQELNAAIKMLSQKLDQKGA